MNENPIPAEWDAESIRRFWNHLGRNTQVEGEYFSYQVGKALVRLMKRAQVLSTPVSILDFGCGPGFLLEQLLETGNSCSGFDFSDGTVAKVNDKFRGRENWQGAISATTLPVAYQDESFDLVTCIETLEHLLDDMIPPTMHELRRLLAPDGIAFFTTPFAEDLRKSQTYCPFCNHEYHKVQHVRSFDRDSIAGLLSQFGFEVIYCNNIELFELQKTAWGNRHEFKRSLKGICNTIADAIAPVKARDGRYSLPRCSPGPNLCVIARKRE